MYQNAINAANHALAVMAGGQPMDKATEGCVYSAFKVFDYIEGTRRGLSSSQKEVLHTLWTKVSKRD